ncbi:ABC transporter permease [Leeia oryzae]|uniref:ABC transporter permease n=1 Tax=Leeia oryzae TaxID=356662 RepID=UPI00037D05DA|nr:ABC transporter permease [Leeia oryzae]
MIPSLPDSKLLTRGRALYVSLFFLFLLMPLSVVAVFAFNNSLFPTPPWKGFTLDWFIANTGDRTGLFFDSALLTSIWVSCKVAFWVTVLSVSLGIGNAFLLERAQFRGKGLLTTLMLVPLVIPGVILGISILAFASQIANYAYDAWGLELEWLRPGLPLVVAGQFSYIVTIATLTIAARLKRFDESLEEAALNLGATRFAILRTITLPYLKPSIIGSAAVAFLLSFENFNTTLMLVGSDNPLTVLMYGRMREGASPVLNAVSLLLMAVSSIAVGMMYLRKPKQA